jgi:hypothetical protein
VAVVGACSQGSLMHACGSISHHHGLPQPMFSNQQGCVALTRWFEPQLVLVHNACLFRTDQLRPALTYDGAVQPCW